MKTTKAQQKAVSKYIASHYDQIVIRIPKGEREKYKIAADKFDLSLNQLFISAVEKYIEDNLNEAEEHNLQLSLFADTE